MVLNYCFHALGATIANFDSASVKDLVEAAILKKILIKWILKIFSIFCGYISTARGFKPDYIYFVVTFAVNFCVNRVVF